MDKLKVLVKLLYVDLLVLWYLRLTKLVGWTEIKLIRLDRRILVNDRIPARIRFWICDRIHGNYVKLSNQFYRNFDRAEVAYQVGELLIEKNADILAKRPRRLLD